LCDLHAWDATLGLKAAELEITARERPRPTDGALPEDISTRVREWAKRKLAQDRDAIERWAEAEANDLDNEAQRTKAKLRNVDRARE